MMPAIISQFQFTSYGNGMIHFYNTPYPMGPTPNQAGFPSMNKKNHGKGPVFATHSTVHAQLKIG
jgi:hypothetical protein